MTVNYTQKFYQKVKFIPVLFEDIVVTFPKVTDSHFCTNARE